MDKIDEIKTLHLFQPTCKIIHFTYLKIMFFLVPFLFNGCGSMQQGRLEVVCLKSAVYRCENGDRVNAEYYLLSDRSINFVKLKMPGGKEYTLPQSLSASGARYTNDLELVWWIKGDKATAEIRGADGSWQTHYLNCHISPENN